MKIGIIGGTGVGNPEILSDISKVKIHTPYGSPSAVVIQGKIDGIEVATLPRHGEGHSIQPSLVNFRANIRAMKELGVTHIFAITAVGSLREEIEPGHLVFPDQFIDRTTKRKSTFYEGQKVCHIPMAEPFCEKMRKILSQTADKLGFAYHGKGTVITVEGPRFSSRAESMMFRQWGADIINMSTVPEVVLAREAGICYASIAMSTDYDCWRKTEESVSWEMIKKTMEENAAKVQNILMTAVKEINFVECSCKEAIKSALL